MTRTIIVAPRARAQILAEQRWWRENRPKAPGLFDEELNHAFDLILAGPYAGRVAPAPRHLDLRRILLRKTQRHLYYVFDVARDEVLIVALWYAQSAAPPAI